MLLCWRPGTLPMASSRRGTSRLAATLLLACLPDGSALAVHVLRSGPLTVVLHWFVAVAADGLLPAEVAAEAALCSVDGVNSGTHGQASETSLCMANMQMYVWLQVSAAVHCRQAACNSQ